MEQAKSPFEYVGRAVWFAIFCSVIAPAAVGFTFIFGGFVMAAPFSADAYGAGYIMGVIFGLYAGFIFGWVGGIATAAIGVAHFYVTGRGLSRVMFAVLAACSAGTAFSVRILLGEGIWQFPSRPSQFIALASVPLILFVCLRGDPMRLSPFVAIPKGERT